MLTLKNLQQINFFTKRAEILKENNDIGIDEILLPRPMISAAKGELQLLLRSSDRFTLENHANFLKSLSAILGKNLVIRLFEVKNIQSAINAGSMTYIYKSFLQSAIPISHLRADISLEDQWKAQESKIASSLAGTAGAAGAAAAALPLSTSANTSSSQSKPAVKNQP